MDQWLNTLASPLSLDGAWEFRLGDQQGAIKVPGTWEAQGFPHRIDGPAYFRKTIHIPIEWQGQRVQLQFDAVSYALEAHVNDHLVGKHEGLWTPFAFDITDQLRFGRDNTIHLTVFKPGEHYPMRETLAGFLPDVCIPFGGIWQSARLMAFSGPTISNLRVLSDSQQGQVHIKAQLHQAQHQNAIVRIISPEGREVAVEHLSAPQDIDMTLVVPEVRRWSPTDPSLYTVEVILESAGEVSTRSQTTYGFRTLSKQGEQLLFNGEPVLLRGLLNWGWYPNILCPAPDEATIRDEFRRIRQMGYNMVKLCLYVPSPLYFKLADEEGIFLWLELPMWLPEVTDRLRQQAPIEYQTILEQVHNHPSIVIYSLGCELGHSIDADLLGALNDILRAQTSGVLACDNSGSGEAYGGLSFDYADFNDYHFYCDLHYFNPLVNHFQRDWRPPRPWIFGEFCDADDYRNLADVKEIYDGKLPWWLTEHNPIHAVEKLAYQQQQERMAKLDLGFTGQELQQISRQQSFVVRKTILEKVRAHSGMGGYVVTSIRDTPLATSSMFDDLGRFKYDADAFKEFNGDDVLILEQGRERRWIHGGDRPTPVDRQNHLSGDQLDFRIVFAQTSAKLAIGQLSWSLIDQAGQTIQSGHNLVGDSYPGTVPVEISRIAFVAPHVDRAQEYTLIVELEGGVRNRWPLWVYPLMPSPSSPLALYDPSGSLTDLGELFEHAKIVTQPSDFRDLTNEILITSVLNPEVIAFVESGGKAIVLGRGGIPVHHCPFWRESIKLLYKHPVLDTFPHKGYADLQFYHLATDYAIDTASLQTHMPQISSLKPIMRRLDARLFTVHDYLVEFNIGSGQVLASTLRFAGGTGDQVASFNQNIAGRYLLHQMINDLAN
jgi:hypothetical protein